MTGRNIGKVGSDKDWNWNKMGEDEKRSFDWEIRIIKGVGVLKGG